MKSRYTLGACLMALAATSTTQADLLDRGNGMIYDTVQNITWLQNANYAKTEFTNNPNRISQIIAAVGTVDGHQLIPGDFVASTGRMSWWGSLAWADQLVYGGFDDWRLPNVTQPDPTCQLFAADYSYGHGCQGSEMGYMFYNYLGVGSNFGSKRVGNQTSVDGVALQNIQPHHWTSMSYWSSNTNALFFPFNGQGSGTNLKSATQVTGAWAVRDGDIQPTPAKSITVTHAEWRPDTRYLIVQGNIAFASDLSEADIHALLDQQTLELRDASTKALVFGNIGVNYDGSWFIAMRIRNTSATIPTKLDAKFGDQTSRIVAVTNAPIL